MKKILVTLFLGLVFCNIGFAESYYFKECKLSEVLYGDYLIDFDNNIININLRATNGSYQELTDKIKLIEKNRIVSEKIQSSKSEDSYFIYSLDANSNSIIKQNYKKERGIDLIRPDGPKKQSYCANVKADWDKSKNKSVEGNKEQKQSFYIESSLPKCQGNDSRLWVNCQGTYSNEDEYKYIGEWKDGKQHGQGIEMWKDGRKFVGKFKDDKHHGKGTLTLPDGTKYVGDWKNGKQHGQGTYIWSRGDKYVGEFKDGKQHGQGTYTFNNGTIHSGQFKDGKILEGTATYPNGTKYIGEFEFDKPHGQGTYKYSNGGKYIGQFIDGYEYGEGICVKPNGSSIKCKIENRDAYLGNNKYKISYSKNYLSKKNDFTAEKKIKNDFMKRASVICSLTKNFDIIEQKVEVLEIDETPPFAGWDGKSIGIKLGIEGVVECKWSN